MTLRRSVYRIAIPVVDDSQRLELPGFLRVVHVAPARGVDNGTVIELWYEVTTAAPQPVTVTIWVHGTGHPIEHEGTHVGSTICAGGALVWHVYVAV